MSSLDAVRYLVGAHVKLHRIEGKLPAGTNLQIHAHVPSLRGVPARKVLEEMFDTGNFLDTLARYSSNTPLTFTLDVPEGAEQETAKVLRAMADELTGGKS